MTRAAFSMARATVAFAIFSAAALQQEARAADGSFPALDLKLVAETSTGYLSSGGTLGDTRPVATQCGIWKLDTGRFGHFSGYVWTISSLHHRQRDRHRDAFNQTEQAAYWGYDIDFTDDVTLRTKGGILWNPTIGYRDRCDNNWGGQFIQSLDNPFVVPYINWLGMLQPSIRERARIGIERRFPFFFEGVSVTPFVETVWMDSRRFQSRYGGIPQDRFVGGAFATVTSGARLDWRVSESFSIFARLRQYDVVNSQSRRAVKKKSDYYSRRDCTVFGIGVEWRF